MARYLDPKNDLTFKRVSGEYKHLCTRTTNSGVQWTLNGLRD